MAAMGERSSSHLDVTLNVYDFVKNSDTVSGSFLSLLGCGIHHSGLQIEDREYTFNNNGIIRMRLLRMPFCRLNDSVCLGQYGGSAEELDAVLAELSAAEWRAGSYHVLRRNCNHFTEALTRRLIGVDIPGWVNRSAHVASAFGLTTKGINSSITSVNGRASAPKALPSPAQPDPPEIEEPEAARP